MFFEALILGVLIGIARRGRISRLAYVNFSGRPLIYASALFYLGIIIMNLGLYDYSSFLYAGFLLASFVLTLVFLLLNINMKFMFVPLAGLALNLVVFLANGFKFPLAADAAAKIYGAEIYELLLGGKVVFFTAAEGARLSFLGNIIPIGSLSLVSIGDLVAAVGVTLAVQAIISDKFIQNRSRITFSKNILR
ncbi:MAG: DUF5317 family protein [Sedimentibacter sp.]|uniref:DUF5317 family protein n=1 Tax=Sedimentibacter sp. TaxID=1960295 RepID=UPI0031587CBF